MESRTLQAFRHFFPDAQYVASYIGGKLLSPGQGDVIELHNAVTGQQSASYQDGAEPAAQDAVRAAREAQCQWAQLTHAQRGRLMTAAGQEIRNNLEALAQLETLTTGKPIRDCRGEVQRVAEMFEYYAGWTDKLYGDVIPVPSSHLNYTRREPIGVVLQITPWNAPVFTAGWQIAPAIATGNGVVLKPSELTPFSSLALAALIE